MIVCDIYNDENILLFLKLFSFFHPTKQWKRKSTFKNEKKKRQNGIHVYLQNKPNLTDERQSKSSRNECECLLC